MHVCSSRAIWYLLSLLIVKVGPAVGSELCDYVDTDTNLSKVKYCEHGCCKTYGNSDEICCYKFWTVGVIIAVAIAGIIGLCILVALIVGCIMAINSKKTSGAVLPRGSVSMGAVHPYPSPLWTSPANSSFTRQQTPAFPPPYNATHQAGLQPYSNGGNQYLPPRTPNYHPPPKPIQTAPRSQQLVQSPPSYHQATGPSRNTLHTPALDNTTGRDTTGRLSPNPSAPPSFQDSTS